MKAHSIVLRGTVDGSFVVFACATDLARAWLWYRLYQ
jgi:hypothetical protein